MVLFVFIALRLQLLCLNPAEPFVVDDSDSGNVASFVAGWLYEDRFEKDLILGDRAKYQSYVTLVIPMVAITHLFEPDLGRAFVYQMFPIVLIQLVGFYLLGSRVLRHRGSATLFAILTLVPVWTLPGDLWGINNVPLVRMAYGALFPWLLLLALRCKNHPRQIYLFAVVSAAALYVHPVSGVSVAVSGLLGLLALKPETATRLHWLGQICAAGLVWLVCVLPFAWLYLSSFPMSSNSTDVQQVIIDYGVYADVVSAVREMSTNPYPNPNNYYGWGWMWLVWAAGVAGLIVAAVSSRPGSAHRFLGLFLIGILLTSVVVSYVDQSVNKLFDRSPLQIDLIRNIRFLVPFLLLGNLILAHWFAKQVISRTEAQAFNTLIGIFVLGTAIRFAVPFVLVTLPGLLTTSIAAVEPQNVPNGLTRTLSILSELDERVVVLPLADDITGLSVRYAALQPVAWTHKDRNMLIYSSHPDIRRYLEIDALVTSLRDPATATATTVCKLLALTQPDLILIDRNYLTSSTRDTVMSVGHVRHQFEDVALVEPASDRCQ